MKRIFISVILVVSILSACNSSTSTLSFSEIENVPNNVQDKIDSNLKLQLIENGEKGSYVIFQTSGEVKTDVVTKGDTVTIKFNISKSQSDVLKQKTYYLTTDPIHDVIDVLVNGKLTPFDSVTAL
ncbi:peptidylprolyl isomerase [Cytobacillus oceanisediminis]|uniref:peptidylprolyl isomerase n=1 Tax=Cytobacillus oceanisediminis TaxID=665099 RepID=UPI00203DB06C|nr:peptidylprolyl isomerase [Cytobacillus oceanisediminis]MCM3393230.1 peptidylprolyl isomerase [Cytobacillus oceanisediminis]